MCVDNSAAQTWMRVRKSSVSFLNPHIFVDKKSGQCLDSYVRGSAAQMHLEHKFLMENIFFYPSISLAWALVIWADWLIFSLSFINISCIRFWLSTFHCASPRLPWEKTLSYRVLVFLASFAAVNRVDNVWSLNEWHLFCHLRLTPFCHLPLSISVEKSPKTLWNVCAIWTQNRHTLSCLSHCDPSSAFLINIFLAKISWRPGPQFQPAGSSIFFYTA